MSDELDGKTVEITALLPEGEFQVQYTKSSPLGSHAGTDEALTLEDARKLASARQAMGYTTTIIETKSGARIR
jgi:hypothetical protein